jgi:hypothetical protein
MRLPSALTVAGGIGLLLVFSPVARAAGPAPAAEAISVQIAPARAGRAIELVRPNDHFHVVLINRSPRSIRLWQEWCSWGYFALSFEARVEGGPVLKVTKKMRPWDKNFPAWFELSPGEAFLFEVGLEPSIWKDTPLPPPGQMRIVHLRAVFENRDDADARKHGVWTGRVVSPEAEYIIKRGACFEVAAKENPACRSP